MYKKELSIAIQAVKKSEKTFRKYFGTKTQVEMKNGDYRDLVSYADKKIEKDIKAYLRPRFPEYGFIGEEEGVNRPDAEYHWVIDPIDGTTNYLQGVPDCGISLGLIKNKQPVAGVVLAPMLNKLYTARKGAGAKLNGKKIHVGKESEFKRAFGNFGWGRDIKFATKNFPLLTPLVGKMRVFGSAVITLCYIAEGVSDFSIGEGMRIWDYAASQCILNEAGGELILSERPKIQIAANKKLSKKLLKLYGKLHRH